VTIARESPLLPEFAQTSRLYMRMLMGFLGAFFPPDEFAAAEAGVSQLSPHDRSLAADRMRGITAGHRAWVLDAGARVRLRAQWRALFQTFDAVICPIMPTPAYPHDHSPEQEKRRVNIDGKDYPYSDQLARPDIATLPGLPATAIPLGVSKDGLPLGVQIVGPFLEDRTPLMLAELIEREFGGFTPPAMFDD
jgi:amidase